jgi:hypothetical protein
LRVASVIKTYSENLHGRDRRQQLGYVGPVVSLPVLAKNVSLNSQGGTVRLYGTIMYNTGVIAITDDFHAQVV